IFRLPALSPSPPARVVCLFVYPPRSTPPPPPPAPDPARAAIRGGSAGGYTVLRALTAGNVFRAGASHYGIGDLTALARDTHKFESRYLDALLGSDEALRERSPINHLDGLNCPVIFFQGAEDRIVPPNQAQAMVAALRAKGLPVAYLEYPGEGHGFRDGANIAHSIGAEYAFFCRVFGLPVAEGLPDIEVENL
ncbi:MAG: prolyl oligopeptidase family serine peptidase, partial [Gammaproteobacteria bacterium]|nr:prolyl oligopeptidase family serine peptidase [Gammaproteobacteria bacterium]